MKKVIVVLVISLAATVSAGAQGVLRVKISDLEKTIRDSRTPLVVNFWATFCQPCIEELPHFVSAIEKHTKDSVRLLLVSLDLEDAYPDHIRKFAEKRKWDVPIVWLDETNADYFCPRIDSTWTGSIPATLFVNNQTGYRKFYEQPLPAADFDAAVERLLSSGTSPEVRPY